ncbi:MAG: glycerol-3-phosphate acyltransferase [Dehalococcoidales bacterium]|nr:glycerol-3-phosphate acyltransferase [Dehalococcoidales bacterium]
MITESVAAVISGYLLGSIPFAYIAGRLLKGVDIRRVGGGNVGGTNVMREVGTAAGIGVLAADIGKGTLAVLIAQWLGVPQVIVFVTGLAVVVGHSWPVFLEFSGGKGGATTIGVFFALAPVPGAISFGIMLLVAFITSNLRLAMGIGIAFLPLILWGFGGEVNLIIYSVALPLFTGLRALPAVIKSLRNPEERKNFIFDKEHKPWQRKK